MGQFRLNWGLIIWLPSIRMSINLTLPYEAVNRDGVRYV